METHIHFPFRIDGLGRAATTDEETYIRQLIEQVLFTQQGERVNRPNFGSGLLQMVFQPVSDQLTTAVQFLVQGALQQWLGDLIVVEEVSVSAVDSTLEVTVRYLVRRMQERRTANFSREVPA
jgi:phage baseplate assembly protein W